MTFNDIHSLIEFGFYTITSESGSVRNSDKLNRIYDW